MRVFVILKNDSYYLFIHIVVTYSMVTIYVLKLKQNKYYVGKTTQPTFRLNDHFVGGGAAWTKIYKPISIYELIPDRPDSDEQIVTQEYMKKYGIDNVRGGPWCKISLTKYEKDMILQINKGNSDECYKCGSVQHFASQCNKKKTQYKQLLIMMILKIKKLKKKYRIVIRNILLPNL